MNLPDLGVDECWKVLKRSMVVMAKEVCGSAQLCKSIDVDAWWDIEVKNAIQSMKKDWLDHVSCLQTKDLYRWCRNP